MKVVGRKRQPPSLEEARLSLGPLCELMCCAALHALDGYSASEASKIRGIDVWFSDASPVPIVWVEGEGGLEQMTLGALLGALKRRWNDDELKESKVCLDIFAAVGMAALESVEAMGGEYEFQAIKRAAGASFQAHKVGVRAGGGTAIGFAEALDWLGQAQWPLAKSTKFLLAHPEGQNRMVRAFMEEAVLSEASRQLGLGGKPGSSLRL